MYYIAVLTAAFWIALSFLSRKETVSDRIHRILRPFYRIAGWIYKKACIHKVTSFHSIQVRNDLKRLYPKENAAVLEAEYYIQKIVVVLMIITAGTVLGTVVKLQADSQRKLNSQNIIFRGNAGEKAEELLLEARIGSRFSHKFCIEVRSRLLKPDEAEELEGVFWNQLCERILGDNESFGKVNKNLKLMESLDGFPFLVNWRSSQPGLVGYDGMVYGTENPEGESAVLTAVVEYSELSWTHELEVKIVPPDRTREEWISFRVETMLREAQEREPSQDSWQLPVEWEGERISWKKQVEDNSMLFWGMAAAAALCVFFFKDRDLHEQLTEKEKLMRWDYPLIVNKLVLYLGAGMTVRGSFGKIAGEYCRIKESGGPKRPAYEEIVYACHELETGTSEGTVYERFGKRTGLQEYVRLSTLLNQNLKKGSSTLLKRLREEAEKASREERNRQRKAGEEASTKLLVPMVIILAVVMTLVMIPAFSSMGM